MNAEQSKMLLGHIILMIGKSEEIYLEAFIPGISMISFTESLMP